MSTQQKLERLALQILSSRMTREQLEQDWCYRKGKSFEDVQPAFQKGLRRGAGKLESELMFAAFALDHVLYPRRESK